MSGQLSDSDKRLLLRLARESLAAAARGEPAPPVDPAQFPPALTRLGSCFITLTEDGDLRGCIGGLQAEHPLYADVRLHAAMAGLNDPRFPPVSAPEVPHIEIEVSVLTEPQPLRYNRPEDLPRRLRPEVDGVILIHGPRRATFLPQVWEKVPDPEKFLAMLCEKMGVPANTWRKTKLEVQIYQVEKFTEGEFSIHRA
jgi:AmmeMemoRadiSam system protein A